MKKDRPCSRFEARASIRADIASRRVTGAALRYGDSAQLWPGTEEGIEPGAFKGRIDRFINVTLQHLRELPIGLPVWTDGPDVLGLEFTASPGARQDQGLQDASSGLLRGFSIEFFPIKWRTDDLGDGNRRIVVAEAELVGVSMVDRPAYPRSTFELRDYYAARYGLPPDSRFRRFAALEAACIG